MSDPSYQQDIPGTLSLFAAYGADDLLERDGDIILHPQPSKSPNDPLRMPRWRKYIQLSLILWYKGFMGALSNLLSIQSSGFLPQRPDWDYNDVNVATAILFVGIGWCGSGLTGPVPHIWGVRLLYLFCICCGIVGTAWMANYDTKGDIIGSQLFLGISTSCVEGLAQLSISQIFYQHELADFIALYIASLSAGTFIGPVIGSYIVENMGWQWIGWFGLVFQCMSLFLFFFFLEETSFDRKLYDGHEVELRQDTSKSDNEKMRMPEKARAFIETSPASVSIHPVELVKPYWQRIAIISPSKSIRGYGFKQYFSRLFFQLRVFLFPATWFTGLHWGWGIGWLSFYLTSEQEVWILPPWNYGSIALGIMNVPVFMGAILGCVYSIYATDWFVAFIARRNQGIREAECRLWCMMPSLIFGPLGLLLFGAGTEYKWSWPVPYIGLAFIGANFGITSDISMSYLVDCYPGMALESVIGVSMIYTAIAFILCWVVEPWFKIGQMNTYISCAVVQFFLCCLIGPMIYYGKFFRRKTARMYHNYVNRRDKLT